MRRLAPILTVAVLLAGLWWAFREPPRERRAPTQLAPVANADSRPAPATRPESAPAVLQAPPAPAAPESEPAESRPESTPSTRPVVVIEVVREDGTPIPHASLHAEFSDKLADTSFTQVTDAEGRAELDAHAGVMTWMQVSGDAFRDLSREVSLDSGVRRIVVPTGQRVAGHLVVGGGPPDDVLRIQLTDEPNWLETWSAPDGRFEFFNLPADWRGDLRIPSSHVLAGHGAVDESHDDAAYVLPLSGPTTSLEVRLDARTALKGRLVRPDTKEPAAGWIRIAGGASVATAADGRFRIGMVPEDPSVTLEMGDAKWLGKRTIEVPGPFTGVRDLGEVELAPIRALRLRVRDPAGDPVAGAVAAITGTESEANPTDADGVSSILADAGGAELRVAKLGYTTAIVPLGEATDGPVDVELAPGNQLTIDVRLADGAPPSAYFVLVRLTADDHPFAGDQQSPDGLLQRTGAFAPFSMAGNLVFFPDSAGRIVIGGFKAGAQVALALLGNVLGEVLDESFVVMQAAGSKTIVLRSQVMPRTFEGAVRGEDGAAIPGASWWTTGQQPDYARSGGVDDEGRFKLGGIFGEAVPEFRIEAQGFVQLVKRNVPVPAGGEHAFTLIRARELTIEVVDERGRPVLSQAEVVIRPLGAGNDELRGADHVGPGTYVSGGFGLEDVEISVSVGVAHAGIFHHTRNPVARVVIPFLGGAELHWRRDPRDPASCHVHIESVPAGHPGYVDLPEDLGDQNLEALLAPGIYVARVEGFDEATEEWFPLGGEVRFTIRAYEGIAVELVR